MKFIMTCKNVGETETWEETYAVDCIDAEEQCREYIEYFNSTLRPHEKKREYVSVKVINNKQDVGDYTGKGIIDEAHISLDMMYSNGKIFANQKLYASHKKGLMLANISTGTKVPKIIKVAETAWYSFVETLDVETTENNVLGNYKESFIEGFMVGYDDLII